jgi:hypothetical protein
VRGSIAIRCWAIARHPTPVKSSTSPRSSPPHSSYFAQRTHYCRSRIGERQRRLVGTRQPANKRLLPRWTNLDSAGRSVGPAAVPGHGLGTRSAPDASPSTTPIDSASAAALKRPRERAPRYGRSRRNGAAHRPPCLSAGGSPSEAAYTCASRSRTLGDTRRRALRDGAQEGHARRRVRHVRTSSQALPGRGRHAVRPGRGTS